MEQIRTDLAMEAREIQLERGEFSTEPEGVVHSHRLREGIGVTTVEIRTPGAARLLGKGMGRYVTLELEGIRRREGDAFPRTVGVLAGELTEFLKETDREKPVLVAGLGNRFITPDALGPETHRHILVTRHLIGELPRHFGHLAPVASLAAEVLGNTGVESGEVVRAVCGSIRPGCVIAVDALASRGVERLCRMVQIADGGIAPGSGVGNHRFPLDRESLGVPVIAVGVPTVVDAATLCARYTDGEPPAGGRGMLVTPKDIDRQVAELARLLGYGISLALQPGMTLEELELLLG